MVPRRVQPPAPSGIELPLPSPAPFLVALGDRIRAHRERHNVTATSAAEALAMMAPSKQFLRLAIDKAKGACGANIETNLAAAVQDLRERAHRLDHCMQVMRMTSVSKAMLWTRIKALVR